MWTLIKQLQFYAKNADTNSSIMPSSCEKHQDYSQVLENHPIFQSQYFPVENADMSIQNSSQQQVNPSINYSGLQETIYYMEDDK